MTDNERILKEVYEWGYLVDHAGNVVGQRARYLKPSINRNGYEQVNLFHDGIRKRTYLVHRLVAITHIPNPDNLPEVNHKDGNKLNNHYNNLEWCDRSHNIKHGIKTGLIPKSMVGRTGKKHFRSKPVFQYLNGQLIHEYESTGDAERLTGFQRGPIQDACNGKLKTYKGFTWKAERRSTSGSVGRLF